MADALSPVSAIALVIQDKLALAKRTAYYSLNSLRKQSAFQTQLKWDADVGGETVSGRLVTANAGAANNPGNIQPASLPIGIAAFSHVFSVLITDIEQAMYIYGPEALRDLFGMHVERGVLAMMRQTNASLFSGAGLSADAGVIGMANSVLTNTAPYAGIDPATYPNWSALVLANGGVNRALTRPLMYSLERQMYEREGNYDLIVTTPALRETYYNLFDQVRTFSGVPNGPDENVDLGISGARFNGRPIIADPQCTPNTMYFIDSSMVSVHTFNLQAARASASRNIQLPLQTVSMEGLNVNIGLLPTQNTLAYSFEMTMLPQLQIFNLYKGVSAIKDLI